MLIHKLISTASILNYISVLISKCVIHFKNEIIVYNEKNFNL